MKNKYIVTLSICAFLLSLNSSFVFAYNIENASAPSQTSSYTGLFNFIQNLFSFDKTSLLASVISVTKVSGGKNGSLQQNTSSSNTNIISNIKNSIVDKLAPTQKQAYSATTDKYASYKAYLSGTYGVKDFTRIRPVSITGELVTIHGHDFSKQSATNTVGHIHGADDGYDIQRFLREKKTGKMYFVEDIEKNEDLLPTMDVTLTGYVFPISALKGKEGVNKKSLVAKTDTVIITSAV